MGKSNRHEKFSELRTEFPYFAFEDYRFGLNEEGLTLKFHFSLSGKVHFHPSCFIPARSYFLPSEMIRPNLPSLAFHLGMIELVSYWKAACPPQIIIRPHALSEEQARWWKNLYFKGLGEFFYLNGITTDQESFMQISWDETGLPARVHFDPREEVIIPVGGGKDSIVTLNLLGGLEGSVPLLLNPLRAGIRSALVNGFREEDLLRVDRSLDPRLLDLNRQGFLNGHTPFSALLAFITLLASAMTGKRYIALSNESSANEATVPGTDINHQYSKSFEFERSFRDYVSRFISGDIEYFSFLRPLNELQIARLFSGYSDFFPVFRSCNAGSKTGSWCGNCPKCLFSAIILAPFMKRDTLNAIFGKDLLGDPGLIPYLGQLTGISPEKPFDCVGTLDDVNAAMKEVIRQGGNEPLPILAEYYRQHMPPAGNPDDLFPKVLQQYNEDHHVPFVYESILKHALHG